MLEKFQPFITQLQEVIDTPELQTFENCHSILSSPIAKEFQRALIKPVENLKSKENQVYVQFSAIYRKLCMSVADGIIGNNQPI